jgi:dTDP-4-dehydrorhamnose 3,5-epimerase-like enzyme
MQRGDTMAYATRRTLYTSINGERWVDSMVIECTAAELREEVVRAKENSSEFKTVTVTRISADEAKRLIFKCGYVHGTGYWYDGERIRYAKAGV